MVDEFSVDGLYGKPTRIQGRLYAEVQLTRSGWMIDVPISNAGSPREGIILEALYSSVFTVAELHSTRESQGDILI